MHAAASAGEPYELVVLDLHMPGMDGLELAQAIRKAPSLRAARLIVLTSTPTHRAAARAARIDGYLTKPIRRAGLLEAVARRLRAATAGGRAVSHDRAPPAAPRPRRACGSLAGAEDNPVNQLVIQGMLAKRGYEYRRRRRRRRGARALDAGAYVAVFMDVQMPGLDGFETTRRIRAARDRQRSALPIVAMTAERDGGRSRARLEAGMDDYLAKPLRADQLDAVLERLGRRPRTTPTPASRLVDDGRIRRFLEDYPEIVDRLVALFEDSTPPLLDQLADAAARDDEGRSAHSRTSSGAAPGTSAPPGWRALCRALEEPGARHAPARGRSCGPSIPRRWTRSAPRVAAPNLI